MALSSKLFSSILDMDAYNRSYNVGVLGLSDVVGSKLSDATLLLTANDEGSAAASFYATAWSVGGVKEIAYRGTDYAPPAPLQDIFGGWTIGAGFSAGTQVDLAATLLEQVTGTASHVFYTASVSSRTTL